MIIGVDVDSVLNDLVDQFLRVYNKESNHGLQSEDIDRYYFDQLILPEYRDKIPHYFSCDDVWDNVQPMEGSHKALKSFIDNGHRVLYVTATSPANMPVKERWLRQAYPFIDTFANLIMVQNKQLVKMDILIDDCAENLIDKIDDYGNNMSADYMKICYTQPWNTYFIPDNINSFRFNNWGEIEEFILKRRC